MATDTLFLEEALAHEQATAAPLAMLLAAGRGGIGVGLLAAPDAVGRSGVGDEMDRPLARMFVRAVGARDVALGGGLLLSSRGPARRRWLEGGMLADATDAVATLLAWRSLPARGRATTIVLTIASLALSMRVRGRV